MINGVLGDDLVVQADLFGFWKLRPSCCMFTCMYVNDYITNIILQVKKANCMLNYIIYTFDFTAIFDQYISHVLTSMRRKF